MKDSENEVLNKATDENVVAGVLDASKLSDDAIAEVTGGTVDVNTGNDTGCSH